MMTKWRKRILAFLLLGYIASVFLTKSQSGLEYLRESVSETESSREISADDGNSKTCRKCFRELIKKENGYRSEIERLKKQVDALKRQLRLQLHTSNDKVSANNETSYATCRKFWKKDIDKELKYQSDITYSSFTSSSIYLLDSKADRRLHVSVSGQHKKELHQVIAFAVEYLNSTGIGKKNFLDGIYRHVPGLGTHYRLNFQHEKSNLVDTVEMYRPFGPLQLVSNVERSVENVTTINVVVPLSGRTQRFRQFLNDFAKVAAANDDDDDVYLTVVYFGEKGLHQVRKAMTLVSKKYRYKNMLLLTLNETFSRARGLEVGIDYWKNGDVLVFVCDVDVVFNAAFLKRCQTNAAPSTMAYFPILFSQYNPKIVWNVSDPNRDGRLSKDTGFWRDFGYGMCCVYRSDFKAVGGLDYESSSWGGEDLYLYNKFVKSKIQVIRAIDTGIVHTWHHKECNIDLLGKQKYKDCVASKSLTEASHVQLGHILFDRNATLP